MRLDRIYPTAGPGLLIGSIFFAALSGCVLVSCILHEPAPRIHDEFSYLLMGETFSEGRVSNAPPPIPEFFDSFHILVRPVYASKYFPAQGIFLALGQKLTGHPAVGVWLSSALACAATTWMLQAYLGNGWALLGGILMVLQYGVYSYWSQAYWGGLVAALGGALFFGALRRLWDELSWTRAIWLGTGVIILVTSRPFEGLLAVCPGLALLSVRSLKDQSWGQIKVWSTFILPCLVVLAVGAFATGEYNKAITGSVFKTPYMLHEQQYQEAPPFLILPLRAKLTYSSPILQFYYEVNEMKPYVTDRIPKYFVTSLVRKLSVWWAFYCGVFLSLPLLLPAILRKGWTRWTQIGVVSGFLVLSAFSGPTAVGVRGLIDLLAIAQLAILWTTFDHFWSRLAIGTCSLILFISMFSKWFFPHYFAPAASLVLYLQVEGLRRIWIWDPRERDSKQSLTRGERRRLEREKQRGSKAAVSLGWVVYVIPVACFFTLVMRVEARLNGWQADPLGGPDRQSLLIDDWSLDRANLEKSLEQEPSPQLVFVRYWPNHNINFEWVYNHPDIMHSHVMWARDLGAEHNKLLLDLVPDRKVWLIEADRRHPQLIPYEEAINRPQPALHMPAVPAAPD